MSRQATVFAVLLFVAWVVVAGVVPVFGQAVNGTLLGTLTDPSGAVVGDAKVTATEVSTQVTRVTQSNASGNYVFPDMPPGVYEVVAEAPGFKRETRADLRLDVNSTVRADLRMQPGAVTEVVEVTGVAPILQTDRADVAQKIESTQLEQLPVGGAPTAISRVF